jgi:hypothetical protein
MGRNCPVACVRAHLWRILTRMTTFEHVLATLLQRRSGMFKMLLQLGFFVVGLSTKGFKKTADAAVMQAAADDIQVKYGSDVPVAVIGEDPNESNIAQAIHALQVAVASMFRHRTHLTLLGAGSVRRYTPSHPLSRRPHAFPSFRHVSLAITKCRIRSLHSQGVKPPDLKEIMVINNVPQDMIKAIQVSGRVLLSVLST